MPQIDARLTLTREFSRKSAAKAAPVTSLRVNKQDEQMVVVSPAVEWQICKDENSGGTYYWCKATGETTAVGEPKPREWTEVKDKETADIYWCGAHAASCSICAHSCCPCCAGGVRRRARQPSWATPDLRATTACSSRKALG